MGLLTSNSKLKKDKIYNFDIPAYKSSTGLITCPNAKSCIANCYARQGTYQFSNVKAKHEANLQATLRDDFHTVMIAEIKALKGKAKAIRIHSAGDFYNREYVSKWLKIVVALPEVLFYAYTKSFNMFDLNNLPSNLKIIQSEGGKLTIDTKYPHARVFDDEDSIPTDYNNASVSDVVAIENTNIALTYHGTKKATMNGFINTNKQLNKVA